jgi:hypothetical protein
MKKHVLAGLLLSFTFCAAVAQNKTLGVGATTLNPNAALHVEAPTGNQGFIMPRLTTAQRNATGFTSVLDLDDNGLMVYDTDLKSLFIWDGAKWITSAHVEGGPRLILPYTDTLLAAPNFSNVLRMVYAGSGTESVGVAHFENMNPDNGFTPIFGRTNSAINGVADFVVTNPANNNDALGVSTVGVGTGGSFRVNNPASQSYGVYGETNGDSLSAAVHGNNIGNGFGVFGKSSGSKFASAAVYGEHTGTGDAAGAFRISNSANTYSALYGETNGSGSAIYAQTTGTGVAVFANQNGTARAGQFQIVNPTNTSAALRAYTDGLSNAGFFTINNVTNTFPGVFTTTNGTGAALSAENTGAGNGFAGSFMTTDAANGFPAIQAGTKGNAPGVRVFQDPTSIGGGMDVFIQNPANNALGFAVSHEGTGGAGSFNINNASSASTSLYASTNGTGAALDARNNGTGRIAYFNLNNASSTSPGVTIVSNAAAGSRSLEVFHDGAGDAVYGQTNAAGGSAGNFTVNNAASTASSLFASTNSPNGHAIGAMNNANGRAFSMFSGGLKVSTATLSGGTSIPVRAAAYVISGGGPYSFDAGFTLEEGDMFYFFNNTVTSVEVSGFSIPAGTGKTYIYLAGGLRAL